MAEVIINFRYELGEELGSSPFFATWKAQDRLLDGIVVVKILLSPGGIRNSSLAPGRSGREVFVTAMQTVRSLTVPGWARVLEGGEEQGHIFLVREYVAGYPLQQKIRAQAPLPWREALTLLRLLSRMVEELHQQGWVHGHLHPRNVFISRQGRLKITDVGQAEALARAFGPAFSPVMKSPYLSPEQRRGRPPQPTSDLFGLGMILYELLTGRLPLPSETPAPPGMGLPPIAPPSVWGREVPPELDQITLKLLEKAPANRYASAMELGQELKRLQGQAQGFPGEEGRSTAPLAPPRPYWRPVRESQEKPSSPEELMVPPLAWRVARGLLRAVVVMVGVILSTGLCLGLVGLGAYRYWESSIPAQVIVPDVVGQPREEGQRQIEAQGLRFGVIMEQPSNEVPANHILRTTPAGGRTVRKGRQVQVVISSGKEVVSIPSVVDRTVDQAREMLRQSGLKVGLEQQIPDELVPRDYVVSQSPPAGETLEKGGEVNLVVSKGPVGQTVPTPEQEKHETVGAKEIHAGRVKILVPSSSSRLQQVKIVVRDSQGEHTVYDQAHVAGETVSWEVSGVGDTIVAIYLNGKLVQSRAL